jgi:hypothetical protein
MLKENWFDPTSIRDTLHNLIAASDVARLKTVRPEEFAELLIREVQFLAPYEENERRAVEQYIHDHLSELYRFLHTLAT